MSFLTKLFGGQAKPSNTQVASPILGYQGGGLSVQTVPGGGATAFATPDRTNAVTDLGNTYGSLGDLYGKQADSVGAGFNDLLRTRLASFNNDASAAIGTLNKNLQSRRVLGSSFGQDTLTRANNAFAMQKDQIVADNFLKSLQANNQLITQQYGAYAQKYNTALNELNLETTAAANLANSGSQILSNNAQTQAKLQEQNAEFNAKQNMATAQGIGQLAGMALTGGMSGFSLPQAGGMFGGPGLSQSAMGGGAGGGVFG